MRITFARIAFLLGPLATAVACGAAHAGPQSLDNADASATAGDNPFAAATADAANDGGILLHGSQLCGVTESNCSPDDDGTNPSISADCVAPKPDAGIADATTTAPADLDGGTLHACRVTKAATPFCYPDANREGVDGFVCHVGSDCAPGFDCVDGDKGAVCRRYCCSGSCDGETSKNGGPTFCDIQKPVDANILLAPFCMPIKTCKLLVEGQCGDQETCAIVTDKGDTSCVPKGTAKAGESCDDVHCLADLTCLGSPNNRSCYQLCRTDSPTCGPTQTCRTGSVFQDTTFGVCKDDVQTP